MKKNTRNSICVFLLAVIVCCITGAFSAFAKNDVYTLTGEYKSGYYKDSELEIYKANAGGSTYAGKVIFPSGRTYKGESVLLSESGAYKVEYDLPTEKLVYDFKVYDRLYQAGNNEAEYESARSFATDNNGNTATKAGIYAELTENSSFTYNKVFDISEKTENDLLFSANVIATDTGVIDFQSLTVRFTDAHDAANYFEVTLWHNYNGDPAINLDNDKTNYLRTNAAGQKSTGIENGTKKCVDEYGIWTICSMANIGHDGGNVYAETFDVYYDYATKKVYGNKNNGSWTRLIADLDDPSHFDEPWQGFTTGECYVSLYAKYFYMQRGGVFVTKIVDDDGADFKNNIVIDDEGPKITIDFEDYEETDLPVAVVGCGYKAYAANAYDPDSEVKDVKIRAWFNYHTSSKTAVELKDGIFTPKRAGVYTLEYVCKDYFLNETIKTADIIAINADGTFDVEFVGEYATRAETGTNIPIADYTLVGAVGKSVVTTQILKGKTLIAENVNSFTFRESGVYTVGYLASDRAGQSIERFYNVTVENGRTPKAEKEPIFPRFYIAGYENYVPELYVIDYSDGGRRLKCSVFVMQNGTKVKVDKGVFTPLENGGDCTVIYEAQGKNGKFEKSYSVKCVSVTRDGVKGKIDKKNLFYSENGVTSEYKIPSAEDASEIGTYRFTENGKITFVNPLPMNDFSLEASAVSENCNKILFTLEDYENKNIRLELVVTAKDADSAYVSVNGGTQRVVDGITLSSAARKITLTYNDVTKTIGLDYDNYLITVGDFVGFPSGKAYLSVSADGDTPAEIAIRKVCNQQITDSVRDNSDPILSIVGEYGAEYSLGKKLTVFKAIYQDMITPYIGVKMKIVDPNGNAVADTDGVLLDGVSAEEEHVITLAKYGQYRLCYIDNEGEIVGDFYFNVMDEEAPQVDLRDVETSYKLGDKIKPSARATDNVCGNVEAFITIETPEGKIELVGREYTFTKTGVYKITAFAFDDSGNYGFKTVTVTVK